MPKDNTKDFVIKPVSAQISETQPQSLQSQSQLPSGAVYAGVSNTMPVSKKPCYLITLSNAEISNSFFIALDKPEYTFGYIQVKGIYCAGTEEGIVKGFMEIIHNTAKEQHIEISFPNHRVVSIRSLVFNAVKPVSVNR